MKSTVSAAPHRQGAVPETDNRASLRAVSAHCTDLYAFSRPATLILTILSIASVTALAFLGFRSFMSSVRRWGMICHDRPNGSLIHPHACSVPPALRIRFQYLSTSL